MLIPREDGKVRLYVELGTVDELKKDDRGRPDTSAFTAEKLLEIARMAFRPYTLETTLESVEWWTVYIGAPHRFSFSFHSRRPTLPLLCSRQSVSELPPDLSTKGGYSSSVTHATPTRRKVDRA